MSTEQDELLSADEIESLLAAAQQSAAVEGGAKEPSEPTQDAAADMPAEPTESTASNAEQLLDQAEANLAAAVQPSVDPDLEAAKPFELESFEEATPADAAAGVLNSLHDVELDVRIELGRTELLIEEVTKLRNGSVVPLDKLAGDPVDILVNGRLIARGEVLVLNDNFCVRVAEILTPDY